jgi:FKBP-type peptidyl-prolyl cis-trans isomerase FkpA
MKTIMIRIGLIATILSAIVLTGCLEGYKPKTQEEILAEQLKQVDKTKLASDIAVIEDSLVKWGLVALNEPNGVRYIIHETGTGPKPTLSSLVTVGYAGRFLATGEEFDAGDATNFFVYEFIPGWKTTLPLLNEGTKATLYIPSGLAYGPGGRVVNGVQVIPQNANLIFEIEIKDVQ